MIKKTELNGSQFLAKETMSKATKLIGGPGMIGKIQPPKPTNAKSSPMIMRTMANIAPLSHYQGKGSNLLLTHFQLPLQLFNALSEVLIL